LKLTVTVEADDENDLVDVESAVDKQPGQTQQQKHYSLDKAIVEEREDEDEPEGVCMALITTRHSTGKY